MGLHGNELGAKAGVALAEALKSNTTVTNLDLRSNKLGEEVKDSIEAACNWNRAHISNVGGN